MPKPIIPWMGGKRRLVKQILPIFPEHHTYVEPFCGGAAMFFSKDEARVEVVNDMNGDLVNLYRVIKHHLEEFIRHFKWALISREEFLWQKNTNPETLTDIQRASRFYYLQKLAFGGKVSGQNFGCSASRPAGLNLLRIEEDLSIAHLRLARTYIERLDWAECVRRYDKPETLFYLDPPYWSTAGYGVEFGLEQYELMAELAKLIKGKMVISVNDIPEMRDAFAGLQMKTLDIRYTVGGSQRSSEQQELLILNW
ncbi:DNA adenine methylase [Shewanella baltica]|uniref:DNA adenine methylase n=1 Tax=Shewanella baltica TaxID=62322 RepID=UPI00217F109A|nr:DNA adenine methylase [Shewanella baltica]MCS6175844.1 DNA adenine methylase [Shewanella baltica]